MADLLTWAVFGAFIILFAFCTVSTCCPCLLPSSTLPRRVTFEDATVTIGSTRIVCGSDMQFYLEYPKDDPKHVLYLNSPHPKAQFKFSSEFLQFLCKDKDFVDWSSTSWPAVMERSTHPSHPFGTISDSWITQLIIDAVRFVMTDSCMQNTWSTFEGIILANYLPDGCSEHFRHQHFGNLMNRCFDPTYPWSEPLTLYHASIIGNFFPGQRDDLQRFCVEYCAKTDKTFTIRDWAKAKHPISLRALQEFQAKNLFAKNSGTANDLRKIMACYHTNEVFAVSNIVRESITNDVVVNIVG